MLTWSIKVNKVELIVGSVIEELVPRAQTRDFIVLNTSLCDICMNTYFIHPSIHGLMYACLYIYVGIYVYMQSWYIHTYIHIHASLCIYKYECMYVCVLYVYIY